jgi:5-methylcytosine-specific restriction endonuclease McrA
MPGAGRPWIRETAKFKAECKRLNAECWQCKNTKGPIDYDSPYDPINYKPLRFTVDHMDPTSRPGVDPMRRANWAPCHATCNSSRGNSTRGQYPTSRQW